LENQGTESEVTEKKLHVLVVDDNRDAADSLCTLLRLWGHDCRAAYNEEAGLEAACDYRPDCLMLDIDMPGLKGYTLARRVRTQPGLDRVKLVGLTVYSDEVHVHCAQEAGFDFHFSKPIEHLGIKRLKRLMDTLDELVRIAGKAEEMTRQNVALASETRELVKEVKEEMTEVQEDIREIKEDVKELKKEVREVKEERAKEHPRDGDGPKPDSQAEGTSSLD
jgi:two-component system OmpR family response regulator